MSWRPLTTQRRSLSSSQTIAEGDIIALHFNAWRIDTITRDDETVTIDLTRAYGDHEHMHRRIGPIDRWTNVQVYPGGHVPICSCHGHPFPCREMEAARVSRDAAEVMDRRMERAGIPDVCYACGEAIGSRQKTITYPAAEGNIQLPGYPAPSFHARDQCFDGRYVYARDRAKMLPDAPMIDISMAAVKLP